MEQNSDMQPYPIPSGIFGRWGRWFFGLTSGLFLLLLVAAMILLSQANQEYGRLAVERQAAQAASVLQAWASMRQGAGDDESPPDLRGELPEVMEQVTGLAVFNGRDKALLTWGEPLPAPADFERFGSRISPQPFGDRVIWRDDGHVLYIKVAPTQTRPGRLLAAELLGRRGMDRMMSGPGASGLLVIEFDGGPLLQTVNLRQTLLIILGVAALLLLSGLVWLFFRIQRLQTRLEQQRALARLGTAARTLAHEVRNPLSIIIMQKSLLQRQLGAEHQAALGVIASEAARIEHQVKLVRQVLGQTGSTQPRENSALADALSPGGASISQAAIDPAIWLPATINSLPGWQGRVRLVLPPQSAQAVPPAPARSPALVAMAEPALRSIIVNLVENAFDAYRTTANPDGLVTITCRSSRTRVILEVSDQAGGIPRENRRRIFDPFFTTKANGSGVGLNLSRQLAQEAGGALRYRHLPPNGSCFRLVLPRKIAVDPGVSP